MSAFTRLWQRAPLWRTALITTGVCGVFSVLFPAPWLVNRLPYYGTLTSKVGHMMGRSAPGTEAQPDGGDEGRRMVSQPPMDAQFEGVIPFAGRQLPLPAGKWHPVLNYQDDVEHGEVLTSIFVRSEQGAVTGFIIAQATTQSLPASATEQLEAQCHSTFNFTVGDLPQDGNRTECWMTSPIKVVNNLFITSNQALQGMLSSPLFIPPALQRLGMMGFQLPPVLVDAAWTRIEKSKSGKGVDFATIHTLISPALPGPKAVVPGSPENWSHGGMADAPVVADFVGRTDTWLKGWLPYLRKSYKGELDSSAPLPQAVATDPGFHS